MNNFSTEYKKNTLKLNKEKNKFIILAFIDYVKLKTIACNLYYCRRVRYT